MGIHLPFAILVGAVMGFLGSMPIAGPIAVLVLERGLVQRRREGLGVAMGAAAGESLYAFLAFWGIGEVIRRTPALLSASRLIGAAMLIGIGGFLATRRSAREAAKEDALPLAGQKRKGFFLGLSITLLNPTLIASWTVVGATVHSMKLVGDGVVQAVGFAAGVGCGIVAWFALLLRLLTRFQRGLPASTVDRVLHVTGWCVIALGIGLGVQPFLQAIGYLRS